MEAEKADLVLPPTLFTAGAALRDPQQVTPAKLKAFLEPLEDHFAQQRSRAAVLLRRIQEAGAPSPELSKLEKECRDMEAPLSTTQVVAAQLRQSLAQVWSGAQFDGRKPDHPPSPLLPD